VQSVNFLVNCNRNYFSGEYKGFFFLMELVFFYLIWCLVT
jgi:hypothetical protein